MSFRVCVGVGSTPSVASLGLSGRHPEAPPATPHAIPHAIGIRLVLCFIQEFEVLPFG